MSRQQEEIDNIKSCLPVTEFRSEDGAVMLMDLADQTYIIRVDTDGSSATAYTCTQPMENFGCDAEETAELTGWSDGWEC